MLASIRRSFFLCHCYFLIDVFHLDTKPLVVFRHVVDASSEDGVHWSDCQRIEGEFIHEKLLRQPSRAERQEGEDGKGRERMKDEYAVDTFRSKPLSFRSISIT